MPFLPILRSIGRDWFREPAIRLHYTSLADRRHRLTFILTRPLIEALHWHGDDRILLGLGVGTDIGAFQLARVDKKHAGMKLEQRTVASFRLSINLPTHIHGIDIARLCGGRPSPDVLDHEIGQGMLLARLPPIAPALDRPFEADERAVVPLWHRP